MELNTNSRSCPECTTQVEEIAIGRFGFGWLVRFLPSLSAIPFAGNDGFRQAGKGGNKNLKDGTNGSGFLSHFPHFPLMRLNTSSQAI